MSDVIHNDSMHRYEIGLEGSDDIAAAYYKMDENGHRVLTHTEVPSEFSGQGIASRLARHVFDHARATGIKLVLKCPFMVAWYAKHPEYSDAVTG